MGSAVKINWIHFDHLRLFEVHPNLSHTVFLFLHFDESKAAVEGNRNRVLELSSTAHLLSYTTAGKLVPALLRKWLQISSKRVFQTAWLDLARRSFFLFLKARYILLRYFYGK